MLASVVIGVLLDAKVVGLCWWHRLDDTANNVLVMLHSHRLRFVWALFQCHISLSGCQRRHIRGGWRWQEDSLVSLIESIHEKQDGTRGAEEEGDDGHKTYFGQG